MSVESDQTPQAETVEIECIPLEQSASATSDVTNITKPADGELTTDPYLFDDSGMLHTQEASFFSAFGTLCSVIPDHVQIPHQNYAQDFTVAVTFSSRPSSAASESLKSNMFRVYPSEESEADRLVTKALVLGDVGSAVRRTVRQCQSAHCGRGPWLVKHHSKNLFCKAHGEATLRLF